MKARKEGASSGRMCYVFVMHKKVKEALKRASIALLAAFFVLGDSGGLEASVYAQAQPQPEASTINEIPPLPSVEGERLPRSPKSSLLNTSATVPALALAKRTKKIKPKRSRRRSSRKRGRSVIVRSRVERGILIEDAAGKVITEQRADQSFNPASVVKIITAYGAIRKFGPDHRFVTEAKTDGEVDEKGVLRGNLYVQGIDPDFDSRDILGLVADLKQQGIKRIEGDIIVGSEFSVLSSPSPIASGKALMKVARKHGLKVAGTLSIGMAPDTARLVFINYSETLKQTLKVMLSHSLNSVAEQIGRVSGGVLTLEQNIIREAGVKPETVDLATASGLGRGRVTPRAMMLVIRALREELKRHCLDLQDVLPVAGVDDGTLEKRFTDDIHRGSVVAKTGTLTETDGGVSALAGVMRSKEGEIYFVIFSWHGGVHGFKKHEDELIRQIQEEHGGPLAFDSITTQKVSA